MERAAYARLAFDPHLPIHQFHEAFAYGEAESRAAVLARHRSVSLRKSFEDFSLLLARDAHAGIANREVHGHRAIGSLAQFGGYLHGYLAPLRELDRVSHEVDQDLPHAPRISHQRFWDARIYVINQLDSFLVRAEAQRLHRLADAFAQIERNDFQFQLAGFDLRKVENVVDDREQRFGGELHEAKEFALLGCQFRIENQLRHAQNPVHRRADFVAHRGEECALGLVRAFRGFFGFTQIALEAFSLAQIADERGQHDRLFMPDG